MYNNSNIVIDSLILVPTNEKHAMVQRSMNLNVSNRDLDTIHRMIDQSPTGKLSEMDIASNVPTAMKLSDMPTKQTQIVNGWSERRYRFILTVSQYRQDNSVFKSYIQGYTDYSDMSFSGMVDPNITMIINSIINTISTVNPATQIPNTRVHSSFNVIYNQFSGSYQFERDY